MEADLFQALIDFGMGGIFIAFMIWQWVSSQKRTDKQLLDFIETIEKLRKEYNEKEDDLRTRYDTVIGNYNEERTVIRANISGRVEASIRTLESTKDDIERLIQESLATAQDIKDARGDTGKLLSQHQDIVNKLLIIEQDVRSGLSILQTKQQEAKLKEMARNALKDN